MCLLIESIKIDDGTIINPSCHSSRLNTSRRDLFGISENLDVRDIISVPDACMRGIYKCRVVYSDRIIGVTFEKYIRRSVHSLKLVYDDSIDYSYKYEDKKRLLSLREDRGQCDDILIIKNNRITDTSFSNIAFFDGNKWITPASPLLKGTKRAHLLTLGLICEDEITVADIRLYREAALINAMLELGDTVLPSQNIY
jgi:4-amino-4-deoxychorismate lyase